MQINPRIAHFKNRTRRGALIRGRRLIEEGRLSLNFFSNCGQLWSLFCFFLFVSLREGRVLSLLKNYNVRNIGHLVGLGLLHKVG